MSGNELYDYAKTVSSREEFIKFVVYLKSDFHESEDEWQNNSLDQFLDGLCGFTKDMAGYYQNIGEVIDTEKITWKMAAEILLAATVYGT